MKEKQVKTLLDELLFSLTPEQKKAKCEKFLKELSEQYELIKDIIVCSERFIAEHSNSDLANVVAKNCPHYTELELKYRIERILDLCKSIPSLNIEKKSPLKEVAQKRKSSSTQRRPYASGRPISKEEMQRRTGGKSYGKRGFLYYETELTELKRFLHNPRDITDIVNHLRIDKRFVYGYLSILEQEGKLIKEKMDKTVSYRLKTYRGDCREEYDKKAVSPYTDFLISRRAKI